MKIILVEPFAHKPGHFSVEAWQLSQALSGFGVNTILVSFDGFINIDAEEVNESSVRHYSFFPDAGFLFRIVVGTFYKILHLINYSRLTNRLIAEIETFSTLNLSRKISISEEAQIICCNNGELTAFLVFSIFCQNLKLMHTTRDYGRTLPANNFRRKYKRQLENFLCKRAVKNNKIIFSSNVKSSIDAYRVTGFPQDLELLLPGVIITPEEKLGKSEARKHLRLPRDEIILLVFGVGHGGKDFDIIFRAINNDNRNYYVLFAGKTPPSSLNDPRKLSKEYNCEDKVIIVDHFIPDSEVPYYFYSVDAVLLSFKKQFTGTSGVLLQGLGYDLPIISSDTEWIGEQVKNNNLGITFTPEEPESLRGALDEFFDLRDDRESELRENVKKFSQNLSWNNITGEYIHIFNKLLESKDNESAVSG